ncbi:hypothetical protein D9M71_820870 [compost metagenome]
MAKQHCHGKQARYQIRQQQNVHDTQRQNLLITDEQEDEKNTQEENEVSDYPALQTKPEQGKQAR